MERKYKHSDPFICPEKTMRCQRKMLWPTHPSIKDGHSLTACLLECTEEKRERSLAISKSQREQWHGGPHVPGWPEEVAVFVTYSEKNQNNMSIAGLFYL